MNDLKTTDAEKALKELYQQTGDSAVLPSKPQAYYTDGDVKKFLSADQYLKLSNDKGRISLEAIGELTKSEAYKGMSDTEKADAVSDIYKYAGALAANRTYGKELDSSMQKIKDATEKGIGVGDYVAFKNGVQNIKERNTGAKDSDVKNVEGIVDFLESDSMSGLSEDQKDYLFSSTGRSLKDNPYHVSETEKAAESNDYYKNLSGIDQMCFRSLANEYEDAVANGKSADGWIAKAKLAEEHGIVDPYQFVAFQHALLYADADQNGSCKQSEVTAAVNSLSGLTQAQKAYLWQSYNTSWKKNPFGSATVYTPDKKKEDNSAGAKIDKRVGGMMGSR